MYKDNFIRRHIGINEEDLKLMLEEMGFSSLEELINKTIPENIRLKNDLNLPEAITEFEFLNHIKEIASKNIIYKNYIGQGFYESITPLPIKRNIFENPAWYTSYTPYQAEISQGRLEALLNFQTVISELTGLDISNASLLDEASAGAEALTMLYHIQYKNYILKGKNKFFISKNCFVQTVNVVKTRAEALGIDLVIKNENDFKPEDNYFGAIFQYPDKYGRINDFSNIIHNAHKHNVLIALATDLLALTLIKSPAEMDADIAFGSAQRFGLPLSFGGPHPAFFATKEKFKRNMPGRIIGVSKDKFSNKAYRMALQTREQHIKRERATSNICTAQALLAIMAGMYAVYHGPENLKKIATNIHSNACYLSQELKKTGVKQQNIAFFDTLHIVLPKNKFTNDFKILAEKQKINFNYINDKELTISINETTNEEDINEIIQLFESFMNINCTIRNNELKNYSLPVELKRKSKYMQQSLFHSYRTETEIMRYIKKLENKDYSLTHGMIPLGSCTMKLNAVAELYPVSMDEFLNIHPYAPDYQTEGYKFIINELEKFLCEITGFAKVSFQPNSGAQGEYAGLLTIKKFLESKGENHRNVVLIPESAHGTNPASSVMAGFKVVIVKCDENGNIHLNDLKAKAVQYKNNLAALMVTYPSTHGVFEETIVEVTDIIHKYGGQVYMDGANMNAQVGLTNPALIGADICHLNLHKTFAIPHGGGGPGEGPIAAAKHLAPFLPDNPKNENAVNCVSASQYGSALILLISYAYIKLLGKKGLKKSTEIAILNANYLLKKIEKYFPVLYKGKNGTVAHELIFDCRQFKKEKNIDVEDIAKRLMDYNFHAPTISFPVHGTLMVEPTESESKKELDRFCKAMQGIYYEIAEIDINDSNKDDNVLKNAPHTIYELTKEQWTHNYSKNKAVFPDDNLKDNKFWPSVARIDNAYGDRNLICTCIEKANPENS